MADFNRHLKQNKILVYFTIIIFIYMSCFSSCSKSGQQQGTEEGQKSDQVKRTEQNEVPKAETASNQKTAESNKSAQSDKSDEGCGCPPGVEASVENAGQKKPLTQEEAKQMADKLERYFQALEELSKKIPPDTFDPQAIVDKVGKDPEALFKWVRDNTQLVPYRGFLRGPVGVLMDRRGNSLDRALLLHELVRLAGFEVRLARARLSREQAEEAHKKSQAIPPVTGPSVEESSSKELDNLSEENLQKYRIDPVVFKKYVSRASQEDEKFFKELTERTAKQADFITHAVERYQKKEDAETMGAPIDELKDHWWVQLKKEGAWTDLDPASKEIAPGSSISPAENICQLKELDQDLIHSVDFRVIIEQWKDGIAEEKTVLTHRLIPAELLGKKIVFSHVPMNWPKNSNLLGDQDPVQKLKSTVLEQNEWQPVLTVGSDRIAQSSFTAAGDINKNAGQKRRSPGVQGITGGIFGALGGKEGEKEEEPTSVLTAEWVDYTIHVPGRPDRTTRRQIFDLIGPAARKKAEIPPPNLSDAARLNRGLILLSETDILIQGCRFSAEFMVHLMANIYLSNRQILEEIVRPTNSSERDGNMFSKIENLTPLPGLEYILSEARMSWSELESRIYLGQPNILTFARRPKLGPNGIIVVRSGFDVISNAVSFVPELERDPFQARIYQGIVDTNVEALILKSIGSEPENTAEIFARSEEQQIRWVALNDATSLGWRGLEATDDIRARMEQDISDGYVVIAPQKEILLGERRVYAWWRVDPVSGSILGIGPEGGQALAEYAMDVAHIVSALTCLIEFAHVKSTATLFCRIAACVMISGLGVFSHFAWSKLRWLGKIYNFQKGWMTAIVVKEWRIAFGISAIMGMTSEVISQLCAWLDKQST